MVPAESVSQSVCLKSCNSLSLVDASKQYDRMGYKIISLKPRSKEAESYGWSNPSYMDYTVHWEGHPNNNIGMPLARNNMFVLDIDNKPEYVKSMKAIEDPLVQLTGVDTMFWESETIGISSGRAGSEKYLFRIPTGYENVMRFTKVNWGNKDGVYHTVVEFRCGNGFQDVMPPSIHPSGTKYQFVNGDYAYDMPKDLLMLVCNYSVFKQQLLRVNPDYVEPVRIVGKSGKPYEGEDYTEMWCDKEYLPSWLTKYGYTAVGKDRFLSPHSTSGSPGILLFSGGKKFWSFGASDPFCDGKPHDAYDLLVHYEFDGSYKEAWKYIKEDLGVTRAKNLNRIVSWR